MLYTVILINTAVYIGRVMARVSLPLYKHKRDLESIIFCFMCVMTVIAYWALSASKCE